MRHQVRHPNIYVILLNTILLLVYIAIHTGCVSVKLGNENITKSSTIRYQKPEGRFEEISLKNADQAWQNKNSGTTLSFLSICNDASDPTLESLRDSTLRGLEDAKVQKETLIPYNAREGLKSEISGQLDGVKVIVELLIFKKNFCSYTISLVGLHDKSAADIPVFSKFIEHFEAP